MIGVKTYVILALIHRKRGLLLHAQGVPFQPEKPKEKPIHTTKNAFSLIP